TRDKLIKLLRGHHWRLRIALGRISGLRVTLRRISRRGILALRRILTLWGVLALRWRRVLLCLRILLRRILLRRRWRLLLRRWRILIRVLRQTGSRCENYS